MPLGGGGGLFRTQDKGIRETSWPYLRSRCSEVTFCNKIMKMKNKAVKSQKLRLQRAMCTVSLRMTCCQADEFFF